MRFRRAATLSLVTIALLLSAAARAGQPTTTVIAHGFTTGSKRAWVQAMAEALIARAGGPASSNLDPAPRPPRSPR